MAQSAQVAHYRTEYRSRRPGTIFAWLASWLLGLVLLAGAAGWRYETVYQGRIFEGVSINGVYVGGMTPAEAASAIRSRLPAPDNERLVLRADDDNWVASASELGIDLDTSAMAHSAYRLGREGSTAEQWMERFRLWQGTSEEGYIEPQMTRDPGAIEALLVRIANEIARDPQDSQLNRHGLTFSGTPAVPGRQLDLAESRKRVLEAVNSGQRNVELVVTERLPHVVGGEEAAAKARALVSAPLMLSFEHPELHEIGGEYVPQPERHQWIVDRSRLGEMLLLHSHKLESGQYAWDVRLKPEELRAEIERIAAFVRREPRDARFDYNPETGAITPLVVSQDGLRLDVEATMANVEQALAAGSHEAQLVVTAIPPRVSTLDRDKLNITGLAARGFSDYTGSALERVINVGVAADMFHGIVIPPGAQFSFNEYLGWVVDATGYEEGYIISGNRTEVDVGGGVCQVSTTVFRAAMEAGFEITERYPHAYRVPYYENGSPLGYDATVFSPWVDLKFRNNTENYYLMEVENNPANNTLAINLYGPPTGRQVEIISTVVEEVPHGPPIYEEDPALAPGVVEQVDWEHTGATIKLERVIRDTSGNEIGRDVFWSEYKPWQARYLVGPGG